MINWHISKEDSELIVKIVNRFLNTVQNAEKWDMMCLEMDLVACHLNGCPLKLQQMLEWERNFDIIHDVAGIHANIDRRTGKLMNCFLPRFYDSSKEKTDE